VVDLPLLLAPSSGPVAARFAYERGQPFRGGQRRTLGFAAPSGSRVVAACGGPVTFAGRVPGGGTVAVRCGRWSVVVGGLERVTARAGARIAPGRSLGTAAGRGVSLSVRRAGDRFGYVDPQPLLRAVPPPRRFLPVGPAPRPRPPVVVPERVVVPARWRARGPEPVALGQSVGAPSSTPVPPLAWLGLVLAALGVPAAGRRRSGARLGRGRRAVAAIATAGAGQARLDDR
jgi:hypothetical protein